MQRETIFRGRLAYKELDREGPAGFTVKNRTERLEITLYVNATDLGPVVVLGPGDEDPLRYTEDPFVYFRDFPLCTPIQGKTCPPPPTQEVEVRFPQQHGKADRADQPLQGPLQATLDNPIGGPWIFKIDGTGHNAYVEAVVVAFYPPDPEPASAETS